MGIHNKKPPPEAGVFYIKRDYRELLILLKTLPITGPRMVRAAITTIATKTRINAYSTRPCPFSLGANNMGYFLLSSLIFREPSQNMFIFYTFWNNWQGF